MMKFQPGDQLIEKTEHLSAGYIPMRRTVVSLTLQPGYILSTPSGLFTSDLSREYVEYLYELEQREEMKYTLDEARKVIALEECHMFDHKYVHVNAMGFDGPTLILCENGCGKSWKVVEDGN